MKIGMLKGMLLCSRYTKMHDAQREAIRNERLKAIVRRAKETSPYYRQLYKDVQEDFSLSELPPVNKMELMAHFDQWVTDPDIYLADINEFMKTTDNIGRKFKGKYLVFTTSGSTGNPLVALCDKTTNSLMGAINTGRTFTRKSDLKAIILKGGKTVGEIATGG